MTFDVTALRSRFPALQGNTVHFDSPGGSQIPEDVAAAVSNSMTLSVANRGRETASARRADQIVLDAREAIGDLVAVDPNTVIFGQSMTELTYMAAQTLAPEWCPDDEVVVTSLDHDANIRPWVQAAVRAGAKVRWAHFNPVGGDLPTDAVADVISSRTRVVAVTGASNLIGTRPDIPAITKLAHEHNATVFLDAVHLASHVAIDRSALGADLLTISPYKMFGPHCSVVTGTSELLETMHPDKLNPAADNVPDRFERGTLPYELLAGVTAMVDFIAEFGEGASRRERIVSAFGHFEVHEQAMTQLVLAGLADVRDAVVHSRAAVQTPTVLFTVEGVVPQDLSAFLAERDINAPSGNFFAPAASDRLGLGDEGGVRIGIAPYTTADEVDRLISTIHDAVATLRA